MGIIPFGLSFSMLSADCSASIAATLFRGEWVLCFVASASRTAAQVSRAPKHNVCRRENHTRAM